MPTEAISLNNSKILLSDETIAAFRQSFYGPLLFPNDSEYNSVRVIWNGMYDRKPALIARCTGAADVIDAVNFARQNNLLVTVRGGGHHAAGHAAADDVMMIDLSLMKGIHVDPANRIARAQPGVTWADLDRETQMFGLAVPGGLVSTTGIAGLTLGGGMGGLRRKYGLACDNLLSADIVTADGRFLHASKDENADLFWALRGGGGNFGIVTSFEYQLHPVGPTIMNVSVMYPMEDAKKVLQFYREFNASAPDEVSALAAFWAIPSIEPIPQSMWAKPVLLVTAYYAGDADEGERVLQPLREITTPVLDMSAKMPYSAAQQGVDPFFPKAGHLYYVKSTDLAHLNDNAIDALLVHAATCPTPQTMFILWSYGGAMSRVAADATAFGERNVPYLFSIDCVWDDPAQSEQVIGWARSYIKSLHPFSTGGVYSNFADAAESSQSAYGRNHQRLSEIKTKYDPTNFFRMNQNIKPLTNS